MSDSIHPIDRLQAWYLAQCDGTWEHAYGIEVDTLDNPGWSMRVALADTALAAVPFTRIERHRSEDDWVVCWTEAERFEAACGPLNLFRRRSSASSTGPSGRARKRRRPLPVLDARALARCRGPWDDGDAAHRR